MYPLCAILERRVLLSERGQLTEFMTLTYAPGARIDHYEIIKMLGHGGMSRVYLALDVNSQQKVVLKFLNDDLIGNISVYERYKREVEIGNRLNHPHIQHSLNINEERSDQYLVVEYIQGRTLRAVLEDHTPNPLPVEEALRIIQQICDAMIYCHEHGVYHRDLKPENVMIEEDGNIKIIDFGIALLEGARRVTWRGLTGTVGTPDYMAPEQLKGERGTAASDIYAIGIMLYEMLCGRTPFDGENVFAVMNQHVSQDPPSILEYNPHLSHELATVVMKAVRRDPQKRYQSVKDMRDDLCNLEKVKPVPYHPDKPQAGHLMHEVRIAAIVIVILLVLAIAIGFLAQFAHHAVH
jgi:serine/threonine protein kinase